MRFETEAPEDKRLSLRLLGPPEASLEGLPVRFRIKKALALLCYVVPCRPCVCRANEAIGAS